MSNEDLAVDLIDSFSVQFSNGGLCSGSSTGQLLPGQQQQQEIRYYGTEGYLLQELINSQLTIVYNNGDMEELPPLEGADVYPANAPVDWLVAIASGQRARALRLRGLVGGYGGVPQRGVPLRRVRT